MNHKQIAKELLKRDQPELAKEVLSLSRPKKRTGTVTKILPNYFVIEDETGNIHNIQKRAEKLQVGDTVTLIYLTTPSSGLWYIEKEKTFANLDKQCLAFSTNDFRFYANLPTYTPTDITLSVQKKLNLSPDWRYLDNDRLKSRSLRNNDIIVIARKDNNNSEVELHELGHLFYDTMTNKSGWARVYRQFVKKSPKYLNQSDWRIVDNNPVFVGRSNEGVLEAFADIFKLYFLGKLQTTDGSYGHVMKILTGVSP